MSQNNIKLKVNDDNQLKIDDAWIVEHIDFFKILKWM